MSRLVQLGPLGAAGIGVASMVGAGVFYVWAPAAALAGSGLIVALALAGFIALLNAVTMAQLAVSNPVSGGGYAYGRRYVSPGVGFVSGFLFLAGKTASVAAIAVIAASHLVPSHAHWVAAGLIAVFAVVNISGVRTTATVSIVIALIVVSSLVAIAGSSGVSTSALDFGDEFQAAGVLQAAGLMFFAFAGYARMATMGAEIKSPKRVLPWVIVGTMVSVLVVYAFVGWAVLSSLGVDTLAVSATPVADLVADPWRPLVAIVAVVAALGSLMTILAGMSRTALAMADAGDLPLRLGFISPTTKTPVVAEITVAAIGIAVVLSVDPVFLVGASSGAVLSYYALAHLSGLMQPASERFLPRVVQVLGLVGCGLLVVALPTASVVTALVLIASSVVVWWGFVRPRRQLG